jgi:uncharacterized protein (TIGR03083 family)
MSERAFEIIKALRSGYDDLAARVRTLSADDLARRSGAAEWDISQVLSHLGSGAEISLASLNDALDGTATRGGEFNQGVWARWNAMSRAERADRFLDASETLLRRYEGLDEGTREGLRIDLGFLPAPVDLATASGLRLSEFTYHTWDVKVAFDPGASLASEATPLLFDQAAMFVGFFGKAAELGRSVTIGVKTTSPERSFGLDVGETVAVVDAPAAPDAVLIAPGEWWLRLIAGRHAAEYTPAGVRVTGDAITLDDLRRLFPGY